VSNRGDSKDSINERNSSILSKPPLFKGLSKQSTLERLVNASQIKGRNCSLNRTLTSCSSSTSVKNYLDYRHNETKEKLKLLKESQMKAALSKCTSKPTLNKKSLKIASKLNKNSVDRLYKAKLQKNNPKLMMQKRPMFEPENTFSPNINNKSRGLSRTVKDLYSWNERKNNKIMHTQDTYDMNSQQVVMSPGSRNINNYMEQDEIVDR
jgi:hypothetical protein